MPTLVLRGIPLGEVQGVLFDKDGTLSNSEGHLQELSKGRLLEALARLKGGRASTEEQAKFTELFSKAYGTSSQGINPSGTLAVASRKDNLVSMATIFCLLGETWPEAIQLAEEVFSVVDRNLSKAPSQNINNTVLPGAMDLLKALKAEGVVCALISNDSSSGIESFLNKNKIIENLSPTYWSAENYPQKPHPGAIKGLCNLLDLDPSKCALIGDSDSDLRMAKNANIPIILGYISGWRISPKLSEHQNVIYHWNDLKVQATTKVTE